MAGYAQEGTKQRKRKKRRKRETDSTRMRYLIVICVLLAVLATLLVVFFALPALKGGESSETSSGNDGWYDPAAEVGDLPGRTKEEIQEALNKVVEEGMFNISIASIIVFPDGESEGVARIENIAANRYNMSVTITLDEGDKPVYESKGLKPGQYIENIVLNQSLPKGEYPATALFTAYTQEDLLKVGQVAAKITIIVDK